MDETEEKKRRNSHRKRSKKKKKSTRNSKINEVDINNNNINSNNKINNNNENFLQSVKDKWTEITKSNITKEKIVKFIDEQAELINDSQKLNFMRWDILKLKRREKIKRKRYIK